MVDGPTLADAAPSGDDRQRAGGELALLGGQRVAVARRQSGGVRAGDPALVEVGPLARFVAGRADDVLHLVFLMLRRPARSPHVAYTDHFRAHGQGAEGEA